MTRLGMTSQAVPCLILGLLVSVAAEPIPAPAPSSPPAVQDPVDRDIILNIQRRHIQERDYRASTSIVAADRSRKLNVHAGGALTSSRITLVIVNLHGRIRFHGSLQRVSQVLNRHGISPSAAEESPSSHQ